MKSKSKKQQKPRQRSTLYSPKGKGGQQNTQLVTHEGWMAHQNVKRKLVWVCDNKGAKKGEFMVDELLTPEKLTEYILYCKKYNNPKKEV